MLHGLVRIGKATPTEAAQRNALALAGVSPNYIEVIDEKRGRKPTSRTTKEDGAPHEGWPAILHRARSGDVLVVAHPVVLAATRGAVLEALAALDAKGIKVYDCTRGRVLSGFEDVHVFAKEAVRGIKRSYHRVSFDSNRKLGRREAISNIPLPKLREMWHDPGTSVQHCEAVSGLSGRTIRNRFGNRIKD